MKTFFLIALVIVIFDQFSKFLFKNIHFGIINYSTNTGAAFSLFEGYVGILTLISFFVVFFIIYLFKKNPKHFLPLSFILGGTIGNLIDRFFLGYVRDFIGIGFFPIFNIADSFNVIGVFLLFYLVLKEKNL
jgi:signal peptidase II